MCNLPIGDGHDADRRDSEKIERSTADDTERTKTITRRVILCTSSLDDGEHDLGGRGTEGHQRKVGDGCVPPEDLESFLLSRRVKNGDLFRYLLE